MTQRCSPGPQKSVGRTGLVISSENCHLASLMTTRDFKQSNSVLLFRSSVVLRLRLPTPHQGNAADSALWKR